MTNEKRPPTWRFDTTAAKTYHDRAREPRPVSLPIVQSTTFEAPSSEAFGDLFAAGDERVYARSGNPTVAAAAQRIAALEGADAALVFPSGMSAITTSLLSVLRPGDHVVAQYDVFAETATFLRAFARPFGIATDFVDATRPADVQGALRPNTAVVYLESPSNPLLRVVDIAVIANIARSHGALVLVDSTFASPYLQQPVVLGADLVIHSGTKFLGGHSDVACGAAAGGAVLIDRIRETQVLFGSILDPHASWLLLRGLKTLAVRMSRICESALEVARFLERHEGTERVHYPLLERSEYHALARRQMRVGGGVLSFEVRGGLAEARRFVDALRLIPIATSLGGVETLIEIPNELYSRDAALAQAARDAGIRDCLIRLSVGLEDPADLKADLENGFRALAHAASM